jgi:hypothetical protein
MCLLSPTVFTFISSCSCIAYLGLLILLSKNTCIDLAPQFIILPSCCSRSYLLNPSWNCDRIEFLSADVYFCCAEPDLSMGIRTRLPRQASPPIVGLVRLVRTCPPPAGLVRVSETFKEVQ